jgi:hypothetical protein
MSFTLPSPRRNLTPTGLRDRAADVATSSTIKVATGDFTGGASEDLFTLSSHGLASGDMLYVLWQSAMGVVTGGEGLQCYADVASSSTFHLTDSAGNTIENSADGTVVLLAADAEPDLVEIGIIPNIIVAAHDFTGGSAEDIDTPAQGTKGIVEGDTLVLLYKSAAGTAGTLDATVFAKAPTVTYFQTAATSGGSVVDTTADGTNVWLKTS